MQGLTKRFGGSEAVSNVDLDIFNGEFLTIVGPSGSGKTTLIRMLAGMDAPTRGKILLNGRVINDVPANERPTCMVFQSLALFPHRTIGQNIEFPLKIKRIDPEKRRDRVCQLLDMFALPRSYYDRRITECSGGERQRVALARALAYEPEILFFDEPLSSLDNQLRKHLERELKNLQRRTRKTFVYITHSLEEAMVMSDRIAILRNGRLVQVGTAADIYSSPCDEFAAQFMGEVNLFDVVGDGRGNFVSSGGTLEIGNIRPEVQLAQGERASLMVRPEFIRFLDSGQTTDFLINGRVHERFELGSRIQYQIVVDDSQTEVTVEKLRENQFTGSIGDRVKLGWDLSRTYIIRKADQ